MDILRRREFEAVAEQIRSIDAFGPLGAPGNIRRLGPFAIVVGCTATMLALDPDIDAAAATTATALGLVILLVEAFLPWRRLPRRAQKVPPLVASAGVAYFMWHDGGLDSPVLGVIMLPLIWFVMYETRTALYLGMGVTIALLIALATVEAHSHAILRAVVLVSLTTTVLPAAQRVVERNRVAILALADVANTDALTGLPNRRGFDRRLHDPIAHDERPLGVVYLDLDHFKQINDRLGHDAGDALLVQVGERIAGAVRAGDVSARLGGDEFVVACRGDEHDLDALADRVRHDIAGAPFHLADRDVTVTASVGTSHVGAWPADVSALLTEADESMYRAKAHRPAR